jgi:hypothetical protein
MSVKARVKSSGFEVKRHDALHLKAEVVRPQVFLRLLTGTQRFGGAERRLDGGGDAFGQVVLKVKDVVKLAGEPFRPDRPARCGLHQLHRDAQPCSCFLDRPFQNVAHAQFAPHIGQLHRAAPVGEAGCGSDHEKARDLSQGRNQLGANTIHEVVLPRYTGEVGEGQNGDRGNVGKLGPRLRLRLHRLRPSRKLISDPRHRRDGAWSENLAKGADLNGKVALFHGQPTPDVFQQLLLRDDPVRAVIEMYQNVKCTRTNRHELTIDP